MKERICLLFVVLCFWQSCHTPETYHFFVAGHVYGSPTRKQPGLHPPFVADFDYLRTDSLLRFGVFTGDIVYHSRDSFWDVVDEQLTQLPMPVHFATGNHDEGHKSPYKERYGRTYYAFAQEEDLCIVLNPGLGGWNIWHEQLEFLEAELANAKEYRTIFLFFHHLLWWSPDNAYQGVRPNSLDGRAPDINFWDTVMPLLEATARPVYCFAGDIGANRRVAAIQAEQHGNVHFIASGMGSITKDNYLLVQVDEKKRVAVLVRWLRSAQVEILVE